MATVGWEGSSGLDNIPEFVSGTGGEYEIRYDGPEGGYAMGGTVRSKIGCDFGSIKGGFMRHALGSCLDYDSTPLNLDLRDFDSSLSSSPTGSSTDDLTFNMEDNFMGFNLPPYARALLSDAQYRHLIFRNKMVVKAFYEAPKAYRGQMGASGHSYLQHCVETAALLAKIGANPTVVAVGLLHDTMDDSLVAYDHIYQHLAPSCQFSPRGNVKFD